MIKRIHTRNYITFFKIGILLVFMIILCFPGVSLKAAPEDQSIYDDAGLLTTKEAEELEEKYAKFEKSAGIDLFFITTYEMEGKTDERYLEDFFDYQMLGNSAMNPDSALVLINMDQRVITVQGYGKCEFYINNDRIEYILDDLQAKMKEEAYYDTALLFAKQAEYYMEEEKGVSDAYKQGQEIGESYDGPSNYYGREPFYLKWWFILLVSFAIGGISVGVMAYHSGGKMTAGNLDYLDPNSKGLIAKEDMYLRTTVTRTKRAESSGGSSGGGRSSGGGGVSSGGSSHSGGSRGF